MFDTIRELFSAKKALAQKQAELQAIDEQITTQTDKLRALDFDCKSKEDIMHTEMKPSKRSKNKPKMNRKKSLRITSKLLLRQRPLPMKRRIS